MNWFTESLTFHGVPPLHQTVSVLWRKKKKWCLHECHTANLGATEWVKWDRPHPLPRSPDPRWRSRPSERPSILPDGLGGTKISTWIFIIYTLVTPQHGFIHPQFVYIVIYSLVLAVLLENMCAMPLNRPSRETNVSSEKANAIHDD